MQRFDQILQQEDLDLENIEQHLDGLFDQIDFAVSAYLIVMCLRHPFIWLSLDSILLFLDVLELLCLYAK